MQVQPAEPSETASEQAPTSKDISQNNFCGPVVHAGKLPGGESESGPERGRTRSPFAAGSPMAQEIQSLEAYALALTNYGDFSSHSRPELLRAFTLTRGPGSSGSPEILNPKPET